MYKNGGNNELVSYIIGTSNKLFKMETLSRRRFIRLIAGIVRSLFDTLIYVSNPTSACHIIHHCAPSTWSRYESLSLIFHKLLDRRTRASLKWPETAYGVGEFRSEFASFFFQRGFSPSTNWSKGARCYGDVGKLWRKKVRLARATLFSDWFHYLIL